ncbi:MAG: DUF3108 domain-containing protein [Helicobacteraceae bacterium]|jgi:hypothetical protein|nr:DUF3108 domain-containing protein [Helicobacteraceae bacterium]
MRLGFCLALCAATMFGYESVAKYEVKYSWFDMGDATASLKIDGDRYETEVSAKSKGLAATFSGNRKETYKSSGAIIDGVFVPEKYEHWYSSGDNTSYTSVFFDHNNSQAMQMKEKCEEKKCKYESSMLTGEKYAQNDMLSLYHNVTRNFANSGMKSIEAAAIGSKKRARVEIAEDKHLKTAKSIFKNSDGTYLVVFLNQEIFSSKDGALYINLGEDAIVEKAVLLDTILFGDVIGELKEKRIVP